MATRVPLQAPGKEVIPMARIANVKATFEGAGAVKAVWQTIPEFKLGTITLDDFMAVFDAADALQKEYATKDVELTGVRGKRDDKVRQLGELITRFRAGIRAAHGSDSPLYEQAGGTRASARKAPTRKVKAAAAAATDRTPDGAVAPQQ
jgi:hypothetical protein